MVNIFILGTLGLMLLFISKEIYYLTKPQVEEIESEKDVVKLSKIIKQSAITYLFSQLKVLFIVKILISAALYAFLNIYIMIAFIIGATLSWISGFLAMYFSVTYNKKVALDAIKGYESAFLSSFSVGKTVSLLVNFLALITCYGAYIYSVHYAPDKLMEILIGLSFGASLISIFARIGGGIFTKGADIGADLVGKIESNLNEDDPRNPAVIADAVGDNVGDACGMSADLFETFVVITSAAIAIVSALSKSFNNFNIELIFVILASGAISGILVLLTGWTFNEEDLFSSLGIAMKTFFISAIVISSSVYMCFYKTDIFSQIYCYHAVLATIVGVIASILVMLITEYYTSSKFSSVLKIASASKQGAANNILQGLAIGYRAVFINILLISIALLVSYKCTESLAGIAFACTGMISICSVILALDVFGPVTDNAGGLVEMSKLGEEVRKTTDKLDAIGNMTKATTKGYSIFSAGLAAYILLLVFFADYQILNKGIPLNCCLDNMYVFIGLFIGVAVISLFASQCLISVNKVSITIMEEARHQLKNINNSDFVPDYNKAIEILTFASLREMIIPALMPVVSCIILFYVILFYVDKTSAFLSLVGFIVGSTLAGIYTSISMTVAGGAWDNAKKYLEIIGEKDSEEHKNAVIGDTVGDPFKDTAGPSFNPLIKLIGIVCLLILKAVF